MSSRKQEFAKWGGKATPTVTCEECNENHVAEYSHEGRYGEGAIYSVICKDGLTDYYTKQAVRFPKGSE